MVIEDPYLFDSLTLQDGFLFKDNKLCIAKSPLRGLIIKEAHRRPLADHFGINKTFEVPKELS